MTITSTGYQGTVNEAQWSGLFENCPYYVSAGFGPSAVGGARTVNLAAGSAFAHGVRVVTDVTTPVNLTPPASGGQWHLIVIRRTWGSSAASTIVDLPHTTTDGTVPSTPPTSFSAVPGIQQNPGVVDDQPMAWVHVRAADTTLTVFDLRIIVTGAGMVKVLSPYALSAWAAWAKMNAATTITIGQFSTPGGVTVRESNWRWHSNLNIWYPTDKLAVSNTSGLTELTNLATTAPTLAMRPSITDAYAENNGITYRYVGAGQTALGSGAPTAAWQAWERPPASWSGGLGGGFSGGTSPTIVGLWGISAGQIWGAISFVAGGTGYTFSTTNDATFTLPSNYVGSLGHGRGSYQKGGSTAGGSQLELVPIGIGAAGSAQTVARLRATYLSAAPGSPSQNILGSVITATNTDTFQFEFVAPSAATA